MVLIFRPIDLQDKGDRDLVRKFLTDTKAIGGMTLEDQELDSYYFAIERRQKRDLKFC